MMKSVALSQMIAVWGPVATILGALFEIGLEEGTIQAAGHKKGRKIGGCAKKVQKIRSIHGHSCLTWQ